MISLRMSTGRSSSLSGASLALPLPLSGVVLFSAGGTCAALGIAAPAGGFGTGDASPRLEAAGASSSKGDGGPFMSSSSFTGEGVHVRGVTGSEREDESMLLRDRHVSRAERSHQSSWTFCRASGDSAEQALEMRQRFGVFVVVVTCEHAPAAGQRYMSCAKVELTNSCRSDHRATAENCRSTPGSPGWLL